MEITDETLAEGSLANLFAEILDAMPAGVVLLTPDGKVIEANPQAAAILGFLPRGDFFADKLQALSVDAQGRSTTELALSNGVQRLMIKEARTGSGLRLLVIEDVTQQTQDDAKAAEERRMATIGAMAARLAHQMRTPLTSALLNANLAHKRATDALSQGSISSLIEQLHTLESRVAALLRYTKGARSRHERFSLASAVDTAHQQVATLLNQNRIRLSIDNQSKSQILGPKDDMAFAIVSALENSIEAGSQNIQITVRDEKDYCVATIHDDGAGSKLELGMRYDEPFFTTKPHGSGLGLAIAAEAARACGGDLHATPTRDGFMVVIRGRMT